ncbi:hypothetical protein EPA93_26105 [Ktedonosporobacter rubrisoli]|uniref:Uncharacterized protein n=1 Tax=Ktedonosporobacter rubrisoli TaxID=2509675 RepID=A0A4P6JVB2_KTERU|nr:hypothetical protein [Ktedonosporobacter rubrisoli]QBD79270.1 hypothetical protein EPA93_26105 [Ktedonosporobacter rubrisoli]
MAQMVEAAKVVGAFLLWQRSDIAPGVLVGRRTQWRSARLLLGNQETSGLIEEIEMGRIDEWFSQGRQAMIDSQGSKRYSAALWMRIVGGSQA